MGSHWLLLLLLLVRHRALNLPGSASGSGVIPQTPSTGELNENVPCSVTSTAPSPSKKDHKSIAETNSSSTARISTPKSQEQTTSATFPTSTQSSTGPTEQTTTMLHTPIAIITSATSMSNSMMTTTSKEQGGTSRTTVLSSLVTSAENPKQNQIRPLATQDKGTDTDKSLTMTTKAFTIISSPTTATLKTTVLETTNTQHSTATLTPTQPAQSTLVTSTALIPSPSTSGPTTTTVSEKSALTPAPATLDKVTDTDEPSIITNKAVTLTSEPTTATLQTTVLETTMSGTHAGETAAVPPTPATTLWVSKTPDTQLNTATSTPTQPEQSNSGVSTTPIPSPSTSKSTTSGMGSSVSPSSGMAVATITPSTASNTADNATEASGSTTTTVSEKSALKPTLATLDKVTDTDEPLTTTNKAVMLTSAPTTATLQTTVLETTMSGTHARETAAVPPTPATTLWVSKTPKTPHRTATLRPIQPAHSPSSATDQSPETTAVYSTALFPSSSEITTSSAMAETRPAPLKSSQTNDPRAGACALDEYPASTAGCRCNDSYYAHWNLSRDLAFLHCGPWNIEVALRSCFLKTHHWVLREDAFSKCSRFNREQQGLRVQVFQLEKKEGTCGLHLSTNNSHALYSLDVHLERVLPGSNHIDFRVFNFSCAYPLAVNVSQTLSYHDSIPTIHIPSAGDTIVILNIFTDPELSTPLKSKIVPVGTFLYMVLKSTNSDPDRFALVVNEVFASTSLSQTESKATYHFVNGSCPVGNRLFQDLKNGASIQVMLAFTLSRFLNSDTVYLHARVTLCDKQGGRSCQPTCNGKNPLQRNSPGETGAGNRLEAGGGKWIVFGPLRISESNASSGRSLAGAWMAIFLLMMISWMLG